MVDNWTVVLLLSSWSYFEWESQSKGARHSAVAPSVVAEHSSGSDVTRGALLSGDSGARGAVDSHNNNAKMPPLRLSWSWEGRACTAPPVARVGRTRKKPGLRLQPEPPG